MPLFAIGFWGYALNGVLVLISLVLMLIILIQRGKGGGLAGAFGGAGGSSAFGSRAGDTFTKVTLYTAAIWVLVIMIAVKVTPDKPEQKGRADTPPAQKPADDGAQPGT